MRYMQEFGNDVSRGLDNSIAHWLIFFSELAYKLVDEEEKSPLVRDYIRDIMEVRDGDFFRSFVNHHTEGFVIADEKNVVIAFRGTEYGNICGFFHDWNRNFKTQLTDFNVGNNPDIQVHAGFKEGLDNLWTILTNVINEIPCWENKKIWFTGHSLGGALATLAAMRLSVEKPALQDMIEGIYTFGSPRCGNAAFKTAYNNLGLGGKTIRYENNNDPIVSAPFFLSFIGNYLPPFCLRRIYVGVNGLFNTTGMAIPSSHYYHVGQRRYIDHNGEISNDVADDTSTRLDCVLGRLTKAAFSVQLLDHRHKMYYRAVASGSARADEVPDLVDPVTELTTCTIL